MVFKGIIALVVVLGLIRLQEWFWETHGRYPHSKEDERQRQVVAIATLVSFLLITIIIGYVNLLIRG